ncbi:hypothetical protein SNL152K_1268 [Streptomyces sp. NL15-2K]|nr:hypothetical protein SNL152K_1268 [Streptomyces sp. NL15-2K]
MPALPPGREPHRAERDTRAYRLSPPSLSRHTAEILHRLSDHASALKGAAT